MSKLLSNGFKFRWRQRPPKSSNFVYKQISGRIERRIKELLPHRPWSRVLRVEVDEDKLFSNRDETGLMVWVVVTSAVDVIWAASLMGLVHRSLAAEFTQIKHIVVTAPRVLSNGYIPFISWRFSRLDNRPKSIRKSELNGFIHHLHWCAAGSLRPSNLGATNDLLITIANSPSIQWEAISRLVNHLSSQGFLLTTTEQALGTLTRSDCVRHPTWANKDGITRWKAIKSLIEFGMIDDFVGRQRPLRPVGSTASLAEVRAFIAAAFNLTPEDLKGEDRRAHIMHARHMAAAIMRRVTSRSLIEIGTSLGNRDHATIINGLERIEKWRRSDPMHSWLVESFAQIADNLGIIKISALRQRAKYKLKNAICNVDQQSIAVEIRHDNESGDGQETLPVHQNKDNVITFPTRK